MTDDLQDLCGSFTVGRVIVSNRTDPIKGWQLKNLSNAAWRNVSPKSRPEDSQQIPECVCVQQDPKVRLPHDAGPAVQSGQVAGLPGVARPKPFLPLLDQQ